MTLKELNDDQKLYLKQDMLTKRLIEKENRTPSYGELAEANTLVTDKELEDEHGSTYFVEEDFL